MEGWADSLLIPFGYSKGKSAVLGESPPTRTFVPLVFPKNQFICIWQSTVIFPCHMGVSTTCIWPAWHLFSAWEYIAIIAAVYLIFFQDYLQGNRIRLVTEPTSAIIFWDWWPTGILSRTNPASHLDRSIAHHVSDLHTTCTKAKNGFLIYSEGKFMKFPISTALKGDFHWSLELPVRVLAIA